MNVQLICELNGQRHINWKVWAFFSVPIGLAVIACYSVTMLAVRISLRKCVTRCDNSTDILGPSWTVMALVHVLLFAWFASSKHGECDVWLGIMAMPALLLVPLSYAANIWAAKWGPGKNWLTMVTEEELRDTLLHITRMKPLLQINVTSSNGWGDRIKLSGASQNFQYSFWRDISGNVLEALKNQDYTQDNVMTHKTQRVTRIIIEYQVTGGDEQTVNAIQKAVNDAPRLNDYVNKSSHRLSGVHVSMSAKGQAPTSLCVVHGERPWWMRKVFLCLASICFLYYPYRLMLRCTTAYHTCTIKKEIYINRPRDSDVIDVHVDQKHDQSSCLANVSHYYDPEGLRICLIDSN